MSIPELAESIERDKIKRAHSMSIVDRISAGPELFGLACASARMGIRANHPNWNDEQIEAELSRRLALARSGDLD